MESLIVYIIVTIVVFKGTYCFNSTNLKNGENQFISHKLYRIYPTSVENLEILNAMRSTSILNFKLYFWKEPTKINIPADVIVPLNACNSFENLLNSHQINFTILVPDIQKLIIDQKTEEIFNNDLLRDSIGKQPKSAQSYNFHRYANYSEVQMTNFMTDLEKNYPKICKVYTIGNTVENRPIKMIKIGYPISSDNKKAIWIDAGIHAREWISHTTAMYIINELVTKYDSDPQIAQYVRNLTWYITPSANPDGYEYTRTSDDAEVRLWRKNRSNKNNCKGKSCCMGVDLNRNFDHHWGEDAGSSNDPCDDYYRGPSAFSEPESRAIRDAVTARLNQLQAFITLHSYSQIWMHPWGYKNNYFPDDIADLRSVANQAVSQVKTLYGTKYQVGSVADTLYVASGTSHDWAKSKGIKYAYLIELRPDDTNWLGGFLLSPNEIIPTGRETFEGIKVVADAVLKKNGFKPIG